MLDERRYQTRIYSFRRHPAGERRLAEPVREARFQEVLPDGACDPAAARARQRRTGRRGDERHARTRAVSSPAHQQMHTQQTKSEHN